MRLRDSLLARHRIGVWGLGLEGPRGADLARLPATRGRHPRGRRHDAPGGCAGSQPTASPSAPTLAALLSCDAVVVSPGVPATDPMRGKLSAAGIPVTSGTALWLEEFGRRTVGVTGTKGKSTTVALLGHLLLSVGVPVTIAGNIGLPLLDVDLPHDETAVVELSSYQCELIENSPRIAVVTQLAQDHLGWHGGKDGYWAAKARIACRGAEVLVADPETVEKLRASADLPHDLRILPGTPVTPEELPANAPDSLQHRHNLANLGLVVTAARLISPTTTVPELLGNLAGFAPLEHRLEEFSRARGLTWVDDTLATTPESVVAALDAYGNRPVTLIIGGSDRGVPDDVLVTAVAARQTPLLLLALPDTGTTTAARIAASAPQVTVVPVATIDEAAKVAAAQSEPGAVVLLSPGAPSHNQFRDYTEKSRAFRIAVAGFDA